MVIMPKNRLLVLDANALVHRAFHALPPLTSPKGEPVGALYGLCLTLLNVLKTFRPTHVVAAFDRPGKTFRHEQFEAYKAQRKKTADELVVQIVRAKDILEAFAIPTLDAKGYEADDVIGTVTANAEKRGLESVIVTGDQDTMQLVGELVRVHLLRRGIKDTVTMGPGEVRDRFGLSPEHMVDFKALRGDPSDNIPGVKGIGEKTATDLLQRYGSLEGVYKHVDEVPDAVRKKLETGKKDAFLSRKLVTIARNAPVKTDLDALARVPYDRTKVIALFQSLGFASLLPRLPDVGDGGTPPTRIGDARGMGLGGAQRLALRAPSPNTQDPTPKTKGYRLLQTVEEVKKLAADLENSKGFSFDTETERLGARTQPLHGVSVSWKEGEAFYVPAALVEHLRSALEHPTVPKYGHNLKYDLEALRRAGLVMRPLAFDTMLASYVLAPGTRAHDLDTLSFTILGHEKIPITALIGKGKERKALSAVPLEGVAEYSCEDADMTLKLVRHFGEELRKEPTLHRVFEDIEMPLIPVLAHLEFAGVKLDVAFLKTLGRRVSRKLAALERRVHALAGQAFNVSSTQQLRAVLFEQLRLSATGITRTQTGLSTAAEELEKLRDAHPIISLIQEHRELMKLKGTYLDALPDLVDKETGRIYTTYNQTVAATGRLSSSEPNLQNIPVRTELGQEMRKAFVAERGHVLVAADYSQLQLRLAAHIAKDRAMQAAFREGKDIHAETAAFVFDIPLSKVTSAQRRTAKTLNFGVLYGMGPQAFARAAGVSLADAQRFIDEYMRTYRGIAEYMEEAKAAAVVHGFVETIAGRRRYLPEITSRNPQIRGEAERMAINHPIQGSEADVIKKAMIEIYRNMDGGGAAFRGVKMILTVHDELVFEVPKGRERVVGRAVKDIMEGLEKLSVPLVVDIRAGKSWGSMKPL